MAWPLVLAALVTAEAITGAVVFVMFIKEETIQGIGMAAFQALKYNQKAKAKMLYQKLRDVYILDLAKTVGHRADFDADLVNWAGWPTEPEWVGALFAEYGDWGQFAPYAKPAFVGFVNSQLENCKTMLDML